MATPKHLKVTAHDPSTGEDHDVAEFRLKDGKVQAKWYDAVYRSEMVEDGIRLGRKTLKPGDGEAFLKALVASLDGSSYLHVSPVEAA
jgi:hypothetical protein